MLLDLLVWLWWSHVTIVTFPNSKQTNRCGGSILSQISLKFYTFVVLFMIQLYSKNKVSKSFHFFVIFHWKSLIFSKMSQFRTHRQTDRQTDRKLFFFSFLTIISKTHVNILIHRHIVSETQTDIQLKCIIDVPISYEVSICIYVLYIFLLYIWLVCLSVSH